MASDFSVAFWQSCQRHSYYPNNLLGATQETYTRNGIFQKPRAGVEGKQNLFAKDAASTTISRLGIGVLPVIWTSLDELKHGLNKAQQEPPVQYMSIPVDHAKRLLCCSIDMFTYLMSFYQVPPAVLDLMSISKHSKISLDRHFTSFVGEHTYSNDQRNYIMPISQFGRSGCYLKQCYRLRFLEKAQYQPLSWKAHQVVVHHSFDVLNGQALWITLEGNVSLDERLRGMLSKGGPAHNRARAFELTLYTHLMICHWCNENWQEFIEGIETELCRLKGTVRSVEPGNALAPPNQNHDTHSTATDWSRRSTAPFLNATKTDGDQFPAFLETQYSDLDSSIPLNELDPRDTYNIADIQKLYKIKDQLTEAHLMAKLNSSVLNELAGYYARLHLKVAPHFAPYKSDLEDFTEKIGGFKNRMEACQAQIEDLLSIQRDLKAQMDDIGAFRSLQMNKFFALESRKSADRMEKMTLEATREASSMHVMTIVALIFLPATFTATFMQSGVFQWKSVETQTHQWLFKDSVFLLFFAICSIMTVGCFLLRWGMLYAKRWRRR